VPPVVAAVSSGPASAAQQIAMPSDPSEDAVREREQQLLLDGPGAQERLAAMEGATEEGTERRMTKLQQIIAAQPIAAKVKDSRDGIDFVVVDKGSENFGMRTGDSFSVRRGTAIIGRVVIGDTVESDQSIANITKLVAGMTLQNGDELIQYAEPGAR
jgi:hypothetical protein